MATIGAHPTRVWLSRRTAQVMSGARAGTGGDSLNDEASLTEECASNPSNLEIVLSLFSTSDFCLLDPSLSPRSLNFPIVCVALV